MFHPIINRWLCYMEQGTNFSNFVKWFVGQARRVVGSGDRSLLFNIAYFFPNNLPDLEPILLRLVRE